MGEVRTVLDQNRCSLRHLCLGAYLARHHSWDSAFQSVTIQNLTHLDLVDTRISHLVLARIAHAQNLQSLTLHGTFEEPSSASIVFGSDHVIDGKHTFLPHLESFRFVLVGHDDELSLFQSVTQFLRQRKKLRRLDLGSCPWELVSSLLHDLTDLRVLRAKIVNLNQDHLDSLVKAIPEEISAIHLATVVSEQPLVSPNYTFSLTFLLMTRDPEPICILVQTVPGAFLPSSPWCLEKTPSTKPHVRQGISATNSGMVIQRTEYRYFTAFIGLRGMAWRALCGCPESI
jgi:hypothetical protein